MRINVLHNMNYILYRFHQLPTINNINIISTLMSAIVHTIYQSIHRSYKFITMVDASFLYVI